MPADATLRRARWNYCWPAPVVTAFFDIVLILKRGRHEVSGCEVKLLATRADTDPKVFTRINMHFLVSGNNLKPEAVERAVKLSAEKYCSASIMLGHTAEITHSFEVVAA